jgi:ABC-type polysaccharide/polyol phosphate export permease
MGPLYGALFGQDIASYFQHLAISLILWTFLSSVINEAGSTFTGAEGYIKQIALPLSVHVFRMLAKNVAMLGHNALIVLAVLIFLPPKNASEIWLFPLGFIIVLFNLFWIALGLAVLSARFRDIPQLVTNIIQVAFFLSPVIWKADMLGEQNRFVADFNPLYHFLEIVRAPLLGDPINPVSWIFSISSMICVGLCGIFIFARFRARVPYWI